MPNEIIVQFERFFRERRALLWVCQRYDLVPGEAPHDFDLPETEAVFRYRKEPSPGDETLCKLYWEAIWLEGARSPVLTSLRRQEQRDSSAPRKVVVLASEADAKAQVNAAEFMPVFALSGLLDDGQSLPATSRYGMLGKRTRENVAWELSSRLVEFSQRLLVVLGAQTEQDLARLFEVLAEKPILDLTVLLVLPEGVPDPMPPQNVGVTVVSLKGTVDTLTTALLEIEAPKAGEVPEWAIRVGKRSVKIADRDVARVRESFAILTEKILTPTDRFNMDDLHAFFSGSLDNWKGFAGVGLPVERSYRTQANERLADIVLGALKKARSDTDLASFYHIRLPCESGSGATTLLRQAAFVAANEGFPALVFRPDRAALDLEEVTAFATNLVESGLQQGITQSPVFLIVFDVEHEPLTSIGKLGQTLAAAGRNVVLLQATDAVQSQSGEIAGRNGRVLSPLRTDATPEEVVRCQETLGQIVSRWNLPLHVPDETGWNAFMASSRYLGSDSEEDEARSKFWVALWFFLTQEMDLSTGERFRDALARWIQQRSERLQDPVITKVLNYVAILSSFRLASPLWTVLRPATGGSFNSDLVPALKQMEGIVEWGPLQKSHEDHTLRFVHPTIAVEFLRQRGIRGVKMRCSELRPVFDNLSAGHPADVWLAEILAADVLAPRFEERSLADWDWRLDTFNLFPAPLRNQSKTILHHWARCLYLSADEKNSTGMDLTERQRRLQRSIELLKKALALPQRFAQDEHPSHLYNTLGTAYSRLARLLQVAPGFSDAARDAWQQCCKCFEESIRLSGRTNIEALLAFAKRRVDRAERAAHDGGQPTPEQIEELAEALNLLNEAEEVMESLPSPKPEWEAHVQQTRALALNSLSSAEAAEFIENLKSSPNAELGYFCEAQLLLRAIDGTVEVERAIQVLLGARSKGLKLSHRSLHLLLALLKRHETKRFEFDLIRRLYLELEHLPTYSARPIDQFWHAVTCYQLGEFQEGGQRFARLRELSRQFDNYRLRVREIWRDRNQPSRPRETVARVTRFINEFRADGFVEDLGQKVVLRPRHWVPMPKLNEPIRCVIRFEANGPLAVPTRFESLSTGAYKV